MLGLGFARHAEAFCGFYVGGADAKLFNNATLVVLMREGTMTVLSMQNNYQGPPEKFAMVVPVPVVLKKEDVKTLPKNIFERVDKLAAPRLVEYWEQDPCEHERWMGHGGFGRAPAKPMASMAPKTKAPPAVRILAQFVVGEYEIVILGADDSLALDTWLRKEGYHIPEGAEPILRPYVQAGMKFFVAKVDVSKVKFEQGQAALSPLRFHYASETFSLPVRLGLVNSSGTQDLIVHILAKGKRYEVANYDNVAIPTNLDVNPGAKTNFAAFYATLFDRTLERNPGAVVTEYSWEARSCDPCPEAPLDPSELTVLGADVVGPSADQGQNFVLTRLHARYKKDSLGQDLVFTAGPPIEGGREAWDENGRLETGAKQASYNNFQARYAHRHPWTGAVTCQNPQRGNWGEPPYGLQPPSPKPALKLASAPRGLQLDWLIAPQSLAVGKGGGSKLSSAKNLPAMPASTGATESVDTAATTQAPPTGATATTPTDSATKPPDTNQVPSQPPQAGGCAGCSYVPQDMLLPGFASILMLVMTAWRRRGTRK